MTNAISDLLASAETQLPVFRRLVAGIPYERKGIPNSEMFFLWLCAQAVRPNRILESGRARGQSTLVLARCFPEAEIISVEHDPASPDVVVAAERLKGEANVRLLFGDATRLLPKIAQPGDIALIDGPKGFRGVRFALALLASERLPMIFVHDAGPQTAERDFFEQYLPGVRYSDEPDVVRVSHELDDEEAMEIPPANRFAAVSGRTGYGYGYGLACLAHEPGAGYSLHRIRASLAGLASRFAK
jgi:hypothetical protein